MCACVCMPACVCVCVHASVCVYGSFSEAGPSRGDLFAKEE